MTQFIQFLNHGFTSAWNAFHFLLPKKWIAFPFYPFLNSNAIQEFFLAAKVREGTRRRKDKKENGTDGKYPYEAWYDD
jgi:hypothetical protein